MFSQPGGLWASFGGLIPTVSCSFSSEKSYSPSRLMCCQDTAEPWPDNPLLAKELLRFSRFRQLLEE